ncbi:cora-like Mg2+ transporter protein-domain-containing protein [Paraphysoderma sedebokerense]|nr:cora-like Mg2+ transporter protein-domain-containing protein [Paraphysoderma sedebokerense]
MSRPLNPISSSPSPLSQSASSTSPIAVNSNSTTAKDGSQMDEGSFTPLIPSSFIDSMLSESTNSQIVPSPSMTAGQNPHHIQPKSSENHYHPVQTNSRNTNEHTYSELNGKRSSTMTSHPPHSPKRPATPKNHSRQSSLSASMRSHRQPAALLDTPTAPLLPSHQLVETTDLAASILYHQSTTTHSVSHKVNHSYHQPNTQIRRVASQISLVSMKHGQSGTGPEVPISISMNGIDNMLNSTKSIFSNQAADDDTDDESAIDWRMFEDYLNMTSDTVNETATLLNNGLNAPMGNIKEQIPLHKMYNPSAKFMLYSRKTKVVTGATLSFMNNFISSYFAQGHTFWLNIFNPTDADIKVLAKIFDLHALTVSDLLDSSTPRETCELYHNYIFICTRTFTQNSDTNSAAKGKTDIETVISLEDQTNLYILHFPNFIITIHSEPVRHISHILRRIDTSNIPRNRINSDWILYSFLDDILQSYDPLVKIVDDDVDTIDDLVVLLNRNVRESEDMLRRIRSVGRKVNEVLRWLSLKLEMVKTVGSRCRERLRGEMVLYLRDIEDQAYMYVQTLDHHSEILNRSHSNYLAMISIELTKESFKLNNIMKKLTAVSCIVLPMNVLTGLFGMNVPIPGQLQDTNVHDLSWFAVITAIMVLFGAVAWILGRRYKWL